LRISDSEANVCAYLTTASDASGDHDTVNKGPKMKVKGAKETNERRQLRVEGNKFRMGIM